MQYETGNKNCFKSQVRLILGDRASGVYKASEIFRGAGGWGTSQKNCRHCIEIWYLQKK
jgi:hypothetical protein